MPRSLAASWMEAGIALGLLPVAAAQNLGVRLRVSGNRAPARPLVGAVGELSAPELRLLVLGDGSVTGAGGAAVSDSLAPRLATGLALRLRRRVPWRVIGAPGWTLRRLDDELRRGGTPTASVVFVAAGMNDVLGLTPSGEWRRAADRLCARLFASGASVVAFSGLPPAGVLPGLNWPLGALLAARGRWLDDQLRDQLHERPPGPDRSLVHLGFPAVADRAHVARDGLHASASGHAHWAGWVAERLAREWRAVPEVLAGVA